MRISGGRAAGRQIRAPKGLGVRPTPDRVRQAVFNSLGPRILGASTLDLFSGIGALGLESLSRGAATATFIEKSPNHARWLRKNAAGAGFESHRIVVRIQDVFVALDQLRSSEQRFDLVLADPPFGPKNKQTRSASLSQRLLDNRTLPDLLNPGGRFILGHARRDRVELPGHWRQERRLIHGDSVMHLLVETESRELA